VEAYLGFDHADIENWVISFAIFLSGFRGLNESNRKLSAGDFQKIKCKF
jgi:hypothetical protein